MSSPPFASSSTLLLIACLTLLAHLRVSAFAFLPNTRRKSSFHLNLFNPSSSSNNKKVNRRNVEFLNLEPVPETTARKERIENEMENKAQFVEFGDQLWDLRSKMEQLSYKLLDSIQRKDEILEEIARERLRELEQRDPELVYMLELSAAQEATRDGRHEDAEEHQEKAMAARSCLPQFNLSGLWVGKYGTHGYEMVNITYVGDVLVATKVTGDQNVPRSEITFQADLSPLRYKNVNDEDGLGLQSEALQPIKLTSKAAKKWGTRQLPRYSGLGQVAEEGFINNQWMDGQLIVIGDQYFSFAWIPIEQQIFFGRPSPELALKMLRDHGVSDMRVGKSFEFPPSLDDDVDTQKDFVTRCLEITEECYDDHEGTPVGGIWKGIDMEEEGCFE